MIRVLFVCLGNICRSPMAEAVFTRLVDQAGLAGEIEADSAGTANWHAGKQADSRTLAVLRQHGIPYTGRSRQIQQQDLKHVDYVVVMDSENLTDLLFLDRDRSLNGKLHRLMDFAPASYPKDVPDPYYNGEFDLVYELVEAGGRGLLEHIRKEHGIEIND
jgi:protein-tyrosine phosphatase